MLLLLLYWPYSKIAATTARALLTHHCTTLTLVKFNIFDMLTYLLTAIHGLVSLPPKEKKNSQKNKNEKSFHIGEKKISHKINPKKKKKTVSKVFFFRVYIGPIVRIKNSVSFMKNRLKNMKKVPKTKIAKTKKPSGLAKQHPPSVSLATEKKIKSKSYICTYI